MKSEDLYQAVWKQLEENAAEAEQARQGRRFTKNERTAFRCGFQRGTGADPLRAPDSVWGAAAKTLAKRTAKNPIPSRGGRP